LKPVRSESIPTLALAKGLTDSEQPFPVVYVDCRDVDLSRPDSVERTGAVLCDALRAAGARLRTGARALHKVHIGEPRCTTRMRPSMVAPAVRFAHAAGATAVVAGDTTVAYTGPRGSRENPPGSTEKYEALARAHGWQAHAAARTPFVVLDRPATGEAAGFTFEHEEVHLQCSGVERFSDFHAAGGFAAADTVVNHAHLTLHGLAGFAGAIKSLAMGCSSLTGKLRMHQALLPCFSQACTGCGRCIRSCPEHALVMDTTTGRPRVDSEHCIGCGECVSLCRAGAVELQGEDIHDWARGAATITRRMSDYTMGLMSGRWERCINILHMYDITRLCDCVDERQQPLLRRNPGFLVGMNPFAVDGWGARVLAEAAREEGAVIDPERLAVASESERYVRDTYGIVSIDELLVMRV
jgi:uncharacterized protein